MIQERGLGTEARRKRELGDYTNSHAIIDACRPFAWRDKFARVNMPTPEVAKKAWDKFSYLLKS